MAAAEKQRIIVGISGASGVILGYRLLQKLADLPEVETHLVITEGARQTFCCETNLAVSQAEALADYVYDNRDLAAKISSGSFETAGMIVLPCSMKSLSQFVCGNAENLLARSADVCLKEGRKIVLVPREMPLSKLHLRNLSLAAELGFVIIPPMLTFYNGLRTLEEQMDHILGKIFSQFHWQSDWFRPWQGR